MRVPQIRLGNLSHLSADSDTDIVGSFAGSWRDLVGFPRARTYTVAG